MRGRGVTKPRNRASRARSSEVQAQRRASASTNGSRRLPYLFHPHRCVLCQRVQMVACPDARARSCAIICRLCAAIVSEGFEAHRLEKGVQH